MNNEVIKAMQGKKEHKIRTWMEKNGYKILRVVLFPIWIVAVLKDKISEYLLDREVWSDERATEILNYYIPRCADWDADNKEFYFFDNGRGWHDKKYLKLKDRLFWEANCSPWGGDVRSFLIDKFELEGFTKELGNCSDGWTEIFFKLNEKED